ncbi:BTAD domain-containing putative transcriptional regulator [Streptomyces sp. NPDC002265]|uniref:BTAD domain-containing putative transcriptional regulator n=1 Tax=Streptomyces sp. NPDC002265 TaxID=3154415 RepID=UPI00331B7907
MGCALRFGLLGPPVLYDTCGTRDACGIPDVRAVGSPKVRTLLAALLLEAGRVVSVGSLKDTLWGGAPPASAQASLHNHVTRLRRLLDDPERLRATPPGYVLRVDEGELDVHVFERRLAVARGAHAARDWELVVRECLAALALWRGTPLSGLPSEVGGYAFVQRLKEARLLLEDWRYDAELAVGGSRLGALVPELAALAAEHPLRESYHRQLMLALHRTGRRAEALAVHRDLRSRLVGELGVEPGPGVREAHVEVLRGTPGGLTAPAAPAAPAASAVLLTMPATPAALTAPCVSATPCVSPAPRIPGAPAVRTGPAARTVPAARIVPAARTVPAVPGEADTPPPHAPAEGAQHAPHASAEGVPRTPGESVPRAPRPAQLPPAPAHFTGRLDVLEALRRTLAADPPGTDGTDGTDARHGASGFSSLPLPLAVVSGMAGVGKSALALHVAHGLRDRFPDGQLYINLHGATPGMTPLTPAQALAALLRDLGADLRHIPEHQDAATALLRSLLAPTRTLMVLDDAAHAAQIRPLLPAGPGCAVIVTSRSPLTALDGARRFPLGPLSGQDSAALLRSVSGRDGLDATHPLVELTGRLPLALRVVAARLAARRALTPDVLAGQLAATGRLHHLEYDDLSVRRSLAVAHDALAASERETDRDAARALRRIGALDLPVYGAPLLARLTGTDERRAEAALDRLVDVALLEETAYGRYAPHDLVRDFARELADKDPGPHDGGEPAPVVLALRWYAAVADRVLTAIVEPGYEQDDRRCPTPSQPPGHPAHAVAPFGSPEEAFAWGDLELENVVALVRRHPADTADAVTAAHVSTLARLLFPYVQRSGRCAEMEVLGRAALAAARRLGDEAAEAHALGDLAALHFLTGRQKDALALNDRALALWRRLERLSRIRRCLNNRGLLLEGLGRYEESGAALRQSLEYSRQLNDPYGEAVTHSHLGNLYEHTDPRAAIEQHRRSLALGDEIGAVILQHSAHCNIGYAHLTLGEPAAALPHFEESRRIRGGHGDWHGESQTRLGLVRTLRLLGRGVPAARECAELLSRADARADRYTGGLARHQLGLLLRERGRVEEAYEEWRAALAALDGTDEEAVVAELVGLLAGSC